MLLKIKLNTKLYAHWAFWYDTNTSYNLIGFGNVIIPSIIVYGDIITLVVYTTVCFDEIMVILKLLLITLLISN